MEELIEIFRHAALHLIGDKWGAKAELARAVEIDNAYLIRILKGATPGSDNYRRKIAAALGFPGRKYEDFLDLGRDLIAQKNNQEIIDIPSVAEFGIYCQDDYYPDDEHQDYSGNSQNEFIDGSTQAKTDEKIKFLEQPAETRYFYYALNSFLRGQEKVSKAWLAKKVGVEEKTLDDFLNHSLVEISAKIQKKIALACKMTYDGFLAVGQQIDDEIRLQMEIFEPELLIPQIEVEQNQNKDDDIYDRILNQSVTDARHTSFARPIPMLGLAHCNTEGWKIVMPISVSTAPMSLGSKAFAVIIDGISMKPEGLSPGMICYCDPDQPPLPGDAIYIGTHRIKGGNLGTIKKYLGSGESVGLKPGWIKVRGWNDFINNKVQKSYTLQIPPYQIALLATVIYVRRRM